MQEGGAMSLPPPPARAPLRLPSDLFDPPIYLDDATRRRAGAYIDEAALCKLETLTFTSLQARYFGIGVELS